MKDVSAEEFITSFAAYLKKSGKFTIPDWTQFVKTSCFNELAPYNQDWLYIRAASLARQLYFRKTVGLHSLKDHYGSKQGNGVNREHHRRAGGKVIRHCLQQLGNLGLVGVVEVKDDAGKII